jgi:ankyrin repeat protein
LIDSAKYARESTCDVIALLIDFGAEINERNQYGVTALMNAAQWGHASTVACLLAEGADVNAKANSGASALKFSELSDHRDVVELLKAHGAIE